MSRGDAGAGELKRSVRAGCGVLLAVSAGSSASRFIAQPTAAVCKNQQKGGRQIGRTERELTHSNHWHWGYFILYKALSHLPSIHVLIPTWEVSITNFIDDEIEV